MVERAEDQIQTEAVENEFISQGLELDYGELYYNT